MNLYLVVYVAGQIVGTAGPLKDCPKVPSAIPSRYEFRCERHERMPRLGVRLAQSGIGERPQNEADATMTLTPR